MDEFIPKSPITPEQQQVLDLLDKLRSQGFSLWGHGTSSTDQESFFTDGIRVRQDPDLFSVAIPLDETNVAKIDDWPHQKYSEHPNVVLLAVPNANPDEGIYIRDIENYVFIPSPDTSGGFMYPRELIVAFYESDRCNLVQNPDFDVTTRDDVLGRIRETAAMIRGRRIMGSAQKSQQTATDHPNVPIYKAPDSSSPTVW